MQSTIILVQKTSSKYYFLLIRNFFRNFAKSNFGIMDWHKWIVLLLLVLACESMSAQYMLAIDDRFCVVQEDEVTIDVALNDNVYELLGENHYELITMPAGGVLTVVDEHTFVYAGDVGFYGLDSFYYRVSCGGYLDTARVYVVVQPFPDNLSNVYCPGRSRRLQWGIRQKWSAAHEVFNQVSPLVGDLDGDGVPEIVCVDHDSCTWVNPNICKQLVVFKGNTRELITKIYVPQGFTGFNAAPFGLCRINENRALVVVACLDHKLRAYDINYAGGEDGPMHLVWESDSNTRSNNYTTLGFADFNHDGYPEVYCGPSVFDAATGTKLCSDHHISNFGSTSAHYGYKIDCSFAADVTGDDNLELICGNKVYGINITDRSQPSNQMVLLETCPAIDTIPGDGHVGVADFNLDGHLDILISIRQYPIVYDSVHHFYRSMVDSGTVFFYVWDVYNHTVSEAVRIKTDHSGKSVPLIGDLDGDDSLEVVICCKPIIRNTHTGCLLGYKYHADSRTFTQMWDYLIDEDTYSVAQTLFDFNQDGLSELVVCDQSRIRIVNASGKSHITGRDTAACYVLANYPCTEVSVMQCPIVVDADNDGNTEIIYVGDNHLHGLTHQGDVWAKTRKVWNQYLYNSTCVNGDLTIPRYVFNNAYGFVDFDDPNRLNRPFNNFMVQAPMVDQYGRTYQDATDAVVDSAAAVRENNGMEITVSYRNAGRIPLQPHRITIYNNHPDGGVLAMSDELSSLSVGEQRSVSLQVSAEQIVAHPELYQFLVSINDAGSGLAQFGNQVYECDTANNRAFLPYDTTFTRITFRDTVERVICAGDSIAEHVIRLGREETLVAGTTEYTLVCNGPYDNWEHIRWDTVHTMYLTIHPYPEITIDCVVDSEINAVYLNANTDADWHQWSASPADNSIIAQQYELSIETSPRTDTRYELTAYFSDYPRCKSEESVFVRGLSSTVPEGDVWVPNAFTPEEKNNATFKVQINRIVDYEIYIFDRNGLQLYHSVDIDSPWDGTSRGNLCPQGNYVYLIRYRESSNKQLWHEKKGNVLLLR